MVKGIINEFCVVIYMYLKIDGNQVVMQHQYLLLGVLVLLLHCIPGSKYLLPTKKIISNTVIQRLFSLVFSKNLL